MGVLILSSASLVGCDTREALAPVTELRWKPHQKTHRVRAGETLYAIAFHYDTDFRKLARLNHIKSPYALRIGQVVSLEGIRQGYPQNSFSNVAKANVFTKIHSPTHSLASSTGWIWPVDGQVVTAFIPQQGKKGINIACKKGQKVRSSAAGMVAYAGNGLLGYGNLIIIKHDKNYLTAYGNNARNLVSEGQKVQLGQIIAEAGVLDKRYWGVHFEIRKAGVPVNPLNYLQKG